MLSLARGEASAVAGGPRDEESLLSAGGGDADGGNDRWGWCYWVLTMAALFTFVMWEYAEWYVGQMDEGEDSGGGWAGDYMLLVASVLFIVSNHWVIPDKYVVFYWGTAVAYGLGGVGHFLESSSETSMIIGYYISMTLAFGGDAVRAGWGYALPEATAVTAQRVFTICIYVALCIFALWNLKLVLIGGLSKEDLAASTAGQLYVFTQVLMGVVEACGSIVWYGMTQQQQEGKRLRLLATAINVASWTVVKILPKVFAAQGISTTVAHRLSHYCQYIVMWCMLTLTTKGYVNATAKLQQSSSAPASSAKQGK